jgi:enterochelin esterase family protein
MKRSFYILSTLLFAGIACFAQRAPSISSPEVHADNSVTFKYYSRTAQKVSLSGEFLPGSQPMLKDTLVSGALRWGRSSRYLSI